MRSVEDIRAEALASLSGFVRRPGMYGSDGRQTELCGWLMVRWLCVIDDREDEFKRWVEQLRRFGKLGIGGAFEGAFGRAGRYVDEVASVIAEGASDIGYFEHSRTGLNDWSRLLALVGELERKDIDVDEARERLPDPTIEIGGRVLCYAPPEPGRWLFVDFAAESAELYDPARRSRRRTAGPMLLRDIRLPGDDFTAGLRLTPYGRDLYYGSSWLDQPLSEDSPSHIVAIAEQLKAIERADPSQRRGRR